MSGQLITFEGVEGSGKTTQIQQLAEDLRQAGRVVTVTREPGGCPIADRIRAILLDPGCHDMLPRTELLLYAAARAQHVAEVLRPALQRGEIVLCDRFVDATTAYQGNGRGLDADLILQLNCIATDGLEPDLTLLLDLPTATGLARARERHGRDGTAHEGRFEEENLAFHERVRRSYLALADTLPRFRVIDASGDANAVAQRIREVVRRHMGVP